MKRREGSVPIDSIFHSVNRTAAPAGGSSTRGGARGGAAGAPVGKATAGMGHALGAHGHVSGGRQDEASDEEDAEVCWADAVVGGARHAPGTSQSAPKDLGGAAALGDDDVGLVELSVLKENSPGAVASQAEPPTFLSSWLHDSAIGAGTTLGGKRMRSAPKSLGGRLAELAAPDSAGEGEGGNKVRKMDVDADGGEPAGHAAEDADGTSARRRPRSALGQPMMPAGSAQRPRPLGRRSATTMSASSS